jgi:hypothetical protein
LQQNLDSGVQQREFKYQKDGLTWPGNNGAWTNEGASGCGLKKSNREKFSQVMSNWNLLGLAHLEPKLCLLQARVQEDVSENSTPKARQNHT